MLTRKKNTNTVFGERLRQIRKYRELPQYKLGVLAGLEESSSSARMSRYETGIYEPTFQFAEKLAEILAVSPAYLFCPDDQLAELILVFSTLTDREQQALLKAAKELALGD
jgi:transcriptional regulator with XRE-family HTH domain